MARFILDVNSENSYKMSKNQIKKICNSMNEGLLDGIFRIICIDNSTDNQFHENENNNKLSKKQIDSYNKWLKSL